MDQALDWLKSVAVGDMVSVSALEHVVEHMALSWHQAELLALRNELLPSRYQRNRRMLRTEDQLRLLTSKVAVIGCGGLGGYVLEELARLGVGNLVAVDPDRFEEHNLNRQLFSTVDNLRQTKTRAVQSRIESVNPAVNLLPVSEALAAENAERLLRGADLVVDALDNLGTRRILAGACDRLGIPLVHGAIAGWFGQITTLYPGEHRLDALFGEGEREKGAEVALGNPSFTPAVLASLQVAEACKVLLDCGSSLRGRVLHIDLLEMEFEEVPL